MVSKKCVLCIYSSIFSMLLQAYCTLRLVQNQYGWLYVASWLELQYFCDSSICVTTAWGSIHPQTLNFFV